MSLLCIGFTPISTGCILTHFGNLNLYHLMSWFCNEILTQNGLDHILSKTIKI